MAAAPPSSPLRHWDGSSRVGLLISALTSLSAASLLALPKLLCVFIGLAHLCLRRLRLQMETFQVVHFV